MDLDGDLQEDDSEVLDAIPLESVAGGYYRQQWIFTTQGNNTWQEVCIPDSCKAASPASK